LKKAFISGAGEEEGLCRWTTLGLRLIIGPLIQLGLTGAVLAMVRPLAPSPFYRPRANPGIDPPLCGLELQTDCQWKTFRRSAVIYAHMYISLINYKTYRGVGRVARRQVREAGCLSDVLTFKSRVKHVKDAIQAPTTT